MYISYNICIIIHCFTWNTATYISKLSNSEDKNDWCFTWNNYNIITELVFYIITITA